jgi:hypothetical protein
MAKNTRKPSLSPEETFAHMPSAEDIFDKPYEPAPPLPEAWTDDSIAREVTDEVIAKMLADEYHAPIEDTPKARRNGRNGHKPNAGIKDVCVIDVKVIEVEWLWEKRIPLKLMTILQGIEGVGKSTLLATIASAITSGQGLPDMNISKPANVLWLSAEDDISMMLKPRLLAAGADCKRIFAVGEPFLFNEAGLYGLSELAKKRKPRLIIIDPLFAYTAGDPCKGDNARSITNHLKQIAEERHCAMVLVRHVGKSKGFGDPRAAGLYSIEWQAAARSVLLAGCDPDNPEKRALTQTKNNLSKIADSLGYTIQSDPSSPSKARFSWSGVSDLTARRILETIAADDETMMRQDAEDFLQQVLITGEQAAKDVLDEAKANGISQRTLERAKARLKVKSRKSGMKSPWLWSLPEPDQDRHTATLE